MKKLKTRKIVSLGLEKLSKSPTWMTCSIFSSWFFFFCDSKHVEEERGFLQLYHELGNFHSYDANLILWMPFSAPFILVMYFCFQCANFFWDKPMLGRHFSQTLFDLFPHVSAWGVCICLFKCMWVLTCSSAHTPVCVHVDLRLTSRVFPYCSPSYLSRQGFWDDSRARRLI